MIISDLKYMEVTEETAVEGGIALSLNNYLAGAAGPFAAYTSATTVAETIVIPFVGSAALSGGSLVSFSA